MAEQCHLNTLSDSGESERRQLLYALAAARGNRAAAARRLRLSRTAFAQMLRRHQIRDAM